MQSKQVLAQIGIQQWYPRKLQHPWYSRQPIIVDVAPAIFQVKCMVLLPCQQTHPFDYNTNKILTGMLGVLQLTATQISIAKIYTKEHELDANAWLQVWQEVGNFQPEFILLLDKGARVGGRTDPSLTISFHPQHLAKHPPDKAEAYRDLLTLKEKLHRNGKPT